MTRVIFFLLLQRVYGNDKILGSLFDVCFKQMAKVSSMIPTAYDDDILTVLAEAKAGTMDRALTYGIFAFQLSPEQYTESEMTNEVLRRLNALATDEVKRDYLKKSLENWDSTPPEVLDTIAAVVQKIFGYTLEKAGSPEAMVNALKAFMKEKLKKIERKIKRKKLAQAAAQSKKSTTLVIGASVAVATIALVSALLFMRRQSK
jgi:DNA polymerase II small subunit/DNA polymerase delta subunit B